jgi:hypothetical protein
VTRTLGATPAAEATRAVEAWMDTHVSPAERVLAAAAKNGRIVAEPGV